MKLLKNRYFAMLLISQSALAHLGGDVRIRNQTSYTFVKTRANTTIAFTTPAIIEPDALHNIYLELNCCLNGFPYNPPSTKWVEYSVMCPDGQPDQFLLKIKQDEHIASTASVSLLPVGNETHCIDLSGNLNLQWQWNETTNYSPPTVVIHNK